MKMTDAQRKKLAGLKLANTKYVRESEWRKNSLLQECLAVLEEYQIVEDATQIAQLEEISNSNQVIKISHKDRASLSENSDYYVIWDDAQVAIIKCSGKAISQNWDDIMAVAFDTCIIDIETRQGILVRG